MEVQYQMEQLLCEGSRSGFLCLPHWIFQLQQLFDKVSKQLTIVKERISSQLSLLREKAITSVDPEGADQ